MSLKCRAMIVVPLAIVALATTFGAIGWILVRWLGLPVRFQMPWPLRAGGIVVLGLGLAILGWLSKYRRPGDVLVSTYMSMRQCLRKTASPQSDARIEPLVFQGPQRHVRHPMYFAVVLLWLGWWLVLDYTFVLLLAFFFFLWFNLVVIRFEEAELMTLYSEQYAAYAKAVPRFFPSLRRRWPQNARQ